MKPRPLLLAVAPSLAASALHGGAVQDVSVAGRVGTLGLGADVAVAVHDRVSLRGGAGVLGIELDLTGRFGLDDGRTAALTLPNALYNLGAEVTLGGLRIGAGVLFKSGEPAYRVTLDKGANVVIGGSTYEETEVKTLTTTLSSGPTAPYLLLGFGPRTSHGLSFVADIGVALPVGAELALAATGDQGVIASRRFRDDLEQEQTDVNDDAGGFVNTWPVVSLGVRYGPRIGRGRR